MPKLILFAPCQKAILDKSDNSLSLVGILHGLRINAQFESPEEPIPANAVMQMNWSVGTIWLRSPDDGDKTFEQRVAILTPNNFRMETTAQPFQMTHRAHHLALNSNVFPIGQAGEYKVILLLREVQQGSEWKEIAEFPIEIKHEQQENQAAN